MTTNGGRNPGLLFSETLASHKYRRYHEYNRVNLVNCLVAVQDDSNVGGLGWYRPVSVEFRQKEWDRIEQKLPDWFTKSWPTKMK